VADTPAFVCCFQGLAPNALCNIPTEGRTLSIDDNEESGLRDRADGATLLNSVLRQTFRANAIQWQ
jgi:hypothetical protein